MLSCRQRGFSQGKKYNDEDDILKSHERNRYIHIQGGKERNKRVKQKQDFYLISILSLVQILNTQNARRQP